MTYSTVLFDFDLTLFDTDGAEAPAFNTTMTFEALGWPDKAEVVIVGDNLSSDIAGGRGYGIDTCWYNPNSRSNTTGAQPTHEIRDLTELFNLVEAAP